MKKFLVLFALLCLPTLADDMPIQNLTQYFEYLPNAVHKNWVPYKAEKNYEVTVQFRVLKNGNIENLKVVNSTEEKANASVLNAVNAGVPYKALPEKFPGNGVNTQVELRYLK